MATEDGKVFEFTKRYEERFQPPKVLPVWEVMYSINNGDMITEEVEGHIVSLGPTFMIAKAEEIKTADQADFGISYEDLKRFRRVEKQVQE